jgi:hypothetical protein
MMSAQFLIITNVPFSPLWRVRREKEKNSFFFARELFEGMPAMISTSSSDDSVCRGMLSSAERRDRKTRNIHFAFGMFAVGATLSMIEAIVNGPNWRG